MPGFYAADDVDAMLGTKADLVDGKVPAEQLPPGGSGEGDTDGQRQQ